MAKLIHCVSGAKHAMMSDDNYPNRNVCGVSEKVGSVSWVLRASRLTFQRLRGHRDGTYSLVPVA